MIVFKDYKMIFIDKLLSISIENEYVVLVGDDLIASVVYLYICE